MLHHYCFLTSGVFSSGTISDVWKKCHMVSATAASNTVRMNAIRQPHTPGYASISAATTSGPAMPATAPMVLPMELRMDE